jgi:hypothetical protein
LTAALILQNAEFPGSFSNGSYEDFQVPLHTLHSAGQNRSAATIDEKLLSMELAQNTPSKSNAKTSLTLPEVIPDIIVIVCLREKVEERRKPAHNIDKFSTHKADTIIIRAGTARESILLQSVSNPQEDCRNEAL